MMRQSLIYRRLSDGKSICLWVCARVWPAVVCMCLLIGSIEEKIYQRQVSKQGLSGTVVDLAKKAEHSSFSAEELRDLFSFEPNTSCLTHDLLDCQCTGDGNTPGK